MRFTKYLPCTQAGFDRNPYLLYVVVVVVVVVVGGGGGVVVVAVVGMAEPRGQQEVGSVHCW